MTPVTKNAPPESRDPKPEVKSRRIRFRRIGLGIAILAALALAVAGYWAVFVRGRVTTDDARIAGHMVDVSPQVSGQLIAVHVAAGDHVKAGQLLFELDTSVANAELHRAEAAAAAAEAGVKLARDRLEEALHGPRKHKIAAARARLRRLEADVALAKSKLDRVNRLFEKQAAVRVALDQARATYQARREAAEAARQDLQLLELGTRTEQIDAARNGVAMAEAKLAEARAQVEVAAARVAQMKATAPCSGVVVRRWLDPGAAVMPGRAVLTVFDPASIRVDANIEEQDLREVAIGDEVDIEIDAYPGMHLSGRVAEILLATNSQFSLIPAEGVSGTFIKVAQRVPLRIEILDKPDSVLLAPGLSVEVVIHSGTAPAPPRRAAMGGGGSP